MRLILNGDLIVATVSGDILAGVPVPPELDGLPSERLIVVGDDIVDAATLSRFYIDAEGRKFGAAAPGRQQLDCSWDAMIEPNGSGGWRLVDRLAQLKEQRKAAIDAEAERQRLRWITPGSGQAMTYSRKVDQAKAVLAATNPQPEDYPMLAASIGIDGADIVAVAATVIAMDDAWEQIGAAIEMARLGGKRAVDLAETVEAVSVVSIAWPER